MQTGRSLMKAFNFPRAALPLSAVVRELLSAIPVTATMMLMIIAIPPHATPGITWLLFPAILLAQTAFNTGLSLTAARIVFQVKDLVNVIPILTRFWLYASGVFFSFDGAISNRWIGLLVELNPLHQVLAVTRDLLLYDSFSTARSWTIIFVWSAGMLLFGFVFFWRGEHKYGAD